MTGQMPDPTTAPPWLGSPAVPNTSEISKWLSITSDENREWWFARAAEHTEQANQCWMHDHEARIEKLQKRLVAANERIDWLERHYSEGVAAS